MAATITLGTPTGGRLAGAFTSLAAVYINVDANSVSYTATAGGLAIDLYTVLTAAGPQSSPVNAKDIVGFLPAGFTNGGFWPHTLAVGTVTSTTMPCTIKLQGSGSAASGALSQIADGACTQTFSGWVLVNRGGTN